MARILVIDDDIEACETMVSLVNRLKYRADKAHSLSQGLEKVNANSYDVVFLDVFLPDGSGLDILPDLMALEDAPEVIILTGKGNPDGAELAIKGGVWDYLLKPTSVRDITLTLNRALAYRKEKRGSNPPPQISGIIGSSPGIRASLKVTAKAAQSSANVLITGETGTGKELFASTIHQNSSRSSGNFVVVDCTSLTESLVESTLFGHTKGAFTGAQQDRQGLVQAADGGTLFLDEVGEMPLSLQKVFLRVLQEKQFRPVGTNKIKNSDFRLIAATNRDLDAMVERGEFRPDLLFRIKTIRIHLPPLRHRLEDIRELVSFHIDRLCAEFGLGAKEFNEEFIKTLSRYQWPGNVRELFNILERAIIDAGPDRNLFVMHLPRSLRVEVAKKHIMELTHEENKEDAEAGTQTPLVSSFEHQIFEDIFDRPLPPLKEFKNMAEKTYLGEIIRQCGGEAKKIMEVSGLSRSHFYSLLKKYNLNL